ncbi:MAG: metal ABC transporter substrate-binding protein [Actinomycetota bacterium]
MARARRSVVATALALAMASAGCGGSRTSPSPGLDVVAAFYPLAEAARRVGGPFARVHDITPTGVEPHDLELKPSDVGLIRSADLILYLGGGFQPALEDAIGAIPNKTAAVDLLEGLPVKDGVEEGEATDPHVWLDPLLMIRIVERVAEEMTARFPEEQTVFESRAFTYKTSLEELHRSFADTLATCRQREIVTAHAAFGYLAARYGLEQIAISGLSPEAEPSPRRLEEVARFAEQAGVKTIFFETLVSPRVAETIARTVRARTAVLNPVEGLTEEQRVVGETYASLMRANLAALALGLQCKQS